MIFFFLNNNNHHLQLIFFFKSFCAKIQHYLETVRSELSQAQMDHVGDDFVDAENVLASVDESLAKIQRQVGQQQVLFDGMFQVGAQSFDVVGDVDHFDEYRQRQAQEDVAEEGPAGRPSVVFGQRRYKHLTVEFRLLKSAN